MYNDWEFYNKLLKTPIVHSHLREITNLIRISNFLFIELSPTVTKLGPCHIQRDHLKKTLEKTLEKSEKLQYLCNSMTDLRKTWCDDAQRVSQQSQVHWLLKI